MTRFVLSPAAQADLDQIWDYTHERWGAEQAVGYLREIQRGVERVVANPMIGRACDEVRFGSRKHGVGAHMLYYRVLGGDVIDVVRILHQRMDVDRHFD